MTVQYRIEPDDRGAPRIESDRVSRAQRKADGQRRRRAVPRSSHAEWTPAPDRRDLVEILEEADSGRVLELVPIRYGRMLADPLGFLRGSVAVMTEDLASTPTPGISVQACGDCHLLNFGLFATPERKLVFGINDFDETLRAPFEWDLKRLAVSFMVVARMNGYARSRADGVVATMVEAYREYMGYLAGMQALDVWYTRLDADLLLRTASSKWTRRDREQMIEKARTQVPEDVVPRLTDKVNGQRRFLEQPPLIRHENWSRGRYESFLGLFDQYRASLRDDYRVILDRYHLVDVALKVVGVGSVGTRCRAVLLLADGGEPLILQVKEARHSVLERFAGAGTYDQQGRRVVEGQRLTEGTSDIFLGWFTDTDGVDYYVRQLRDWKTAYDPVGVPWKRLADYARFCGWTLARAHAKSGDAAEIAGYLGKSDAFDRALTSFAGVYAGQNLHDYEAFRAAVRDGRISAMTGV